MERSRIPLLIENAHYNNRSLPEGGLDHDQSRPKSSSRIPRPRLKDDNLPRLQIPPPLCKTATARSGTSTLLTPPSSPPTFVKAEQAAAATAATETHLASPFKPCLFAGALATPPPTPQKHATSPTTFPDDSDSDSNLDRPATPPPPWIQSPSIRAILAQRSPASIIRPRRPKTAADNTTDAAPPDDSINRSTRCLQCEILGLRCDRKVPTCGRCARRRARAAKAAFELGLGEGEGDGDGPCLALRTVREGERRDARLQGRSVGVVLGRVRGDCERVWEQKMVLRRELLEVERQKDEKRNWALPMPVAKGVVDGAEVWKRVLAGEVQGGKKGDW